MMMLMIKILLGKTYFDSRRSEIVLSTAEELLDRKVAAPV
jgi:hypothetical protein